MWWVIRLVWRYKINELEKLKGVGKIFYRFRSFGNKKKLVSLRTVLRWDIGIKGLCSLGKEVEMVIMFFIGEIKGILCVY